MAITLLPAEFREKGARISQIAKAFSKTILVILIIYSLFLILFVGFFVFNLVNKADLTSRQNKLEDEVTNLRDREIPLFVLKDRVETLVGLTRKESNFNKVFSHILELISSDSRLSILDVSSDQNKVKVSISVSDTFALESFFLELSRSKVIPEVQLENLNRFPEGRYVASFLMQL